jgi:phenylpropionate dioxygenase-like ring-hydroxylating dioxygenase large terminal subunit
MVSAIQRLVGAAVVLWSLGRLRRSQAFVAPQLVAPLLQASRSTVIPRHASKMDQSGDVDSAFYSFADEEEEEDAMGLGAWVPVGSVSCLAGLGPSAIEIMGRQMVVWSSSDKSQWSVMTDVCPHRMVPLSQGRVDPQTGCLECPLHGWKFALNGTLQAIPHMEPQQPLSSKGRSVESFPVHRTGDLLWAFLPTSFHGEAFPKTLLPEDYYQGLRDLTMDKNGTFYVQDLPFSYDMLVENGLDGPAHAYFAHHKLGFDRSEVAPIPCEIVVANFSQLVSQVTYTRKGASRE